jgi:hypothetical protein
MPLELSRMNPWPLFPFDATPYLCSPTSLAARWQRLHLGDALPWPEDAGEQAAWALYHSGAFEQAYQAGLALGPQGWVLASQAQLVQAIYLEPHEAGRQELLHEVVERCTQLIAQGEQLASAHGLRGQALLFYGQALCLNRPQAHELGVQIRLSLTTVLRLRPAHAQAHIALATHYVDALDRQGHLLAKLDGADGASVLQLLRQALALYPESVLARLELARALLVLDGPRRQAEAEQLHQQAAQCQSADAAERLHVERARAELED